MSVEAKVGSFDPIGTTPQVSNPVLMTTAGATGKERVTSRGEKKSKSKKGDRHRHGKRSHSTSAAEPKEKRKKKKHRSKSQSSSATTSGGTAGTTTATNIVAVPAAPPVYDDAPLIKEDNNAGYVDRRIRTVLGVQSQVVNVVTPVNQNKLSHESFIQFTVRSSNDEHIRFRRDSLTLMFYATYKNQAATAVPAATASEAQKKAKETAERHALMSQSGEPFMFLDPSVGATAFFTHVDVLINNVPVNSSQLLGGLWLQYVRACQIFSNKNHVRLRSSSDINQGKINEKGFEALLEATAPFDYGAWNSTTGRRLECNLRGVFPFDFKNEAASSADNLKEPNYYFPPNTTFDFRFHFHPDKFAAIFHPEIAGNPAEYFTKRDGEGYGVGDIAKYDLRYQIAGAFLEYDSVTLRPAQSIEFLELMRTRPSIYRYDVIRGQHVTMPAKQAYVDVPFTVAPFARLLYIMFVPSWGVMHMPALRRPLSGFSQFPKNCTKMSILYAGQKPLITNEFERLGFVGEQHHSTQRVLYHYLKNHHVWSGTFDELFPKTSNVEPFNQMLYVDLRDSMADRAENLNIRCSFAHGSDGSPENLQIVVLSVHSTGEVTCRHGGGQGHYDWRWESKY